MIEAEVHSYLRDFLRQQGDRDWPHHLTMARLVARALRLGRSALMQTGSSVPRYCLSYLVPVLFSDRPTIIVAPSEIHQHLLTEEIPLLQAWLQDSKQIVPGDRLILTTPQAWLSDRLNNRGNFPPDLPTIIDRADELETQTRKFLTTTITLADWQELKQNAPSYSEFIDDIRIQLTQAIFSHPTNPYENYLLDKSEQELLQKLWDTLEPKNLLTSIFRQFCQQLPQKAKILWVSRNRAGGIFTIYLAPTEVATTLQPIWQQQPVVIIGSFLDLESDAPIYRQQLGLDTILSLKFSPLRQNEYIQLYIPDGIPMHNTPQFGAALIQQARRLISLSQLRDRTQPIVILVEDVPLQAQVGVSLAAEFGSGVQVEKTTLAENGILVCSWSFWQMHQKQLPTPKLLIIATIPIPSPENPIVASRIAYYKSQRQDWFRLYLLPQALRTMQQAVVPLRESQGIVALLDKRVIYRSYGKTILSALEPCTRINYIDPTWFG
ncbi:MAG: helicase C-terminal domain-containing protein [Pleurocapsa sp.]